ncbi:MAG TPA: hypothetical protein VHC70_03785 [Phycisphaerales bacterium]|nr:hypothetical protein [Phycisphaerales bacterium]
MSPHPPTTSPATHLAPPTAPVAHPSHQTWQYRTKVSYLRYLHTPEGRAEFRLGFPWPSVVITALLFLTIVGIPAAIGHAIAMAIRYSSRKKKFDRAVAHAKACEPLFVYPIMVNTRLRQFQNQRAPGLVVGSFEDLGGEYFAQLAAVLEPIAKAAPNTLVPAEAALRQALTDEKYVENRRRRIPDEFTGGVPVYLFDLVIDGRKLIGGRLMAPRILCMADRGDRGRIFNIPYHTLEASESGSPPIQRRAPEEPRVSDELFALVNAGNFPVGPDHPIRAVVDDIQAPCPRCSAPLVSLLSIRLDAPELRSVAAKLSVPGLRALRIVVCEHCCQECLHTYAAFGPAGELLPDAIRIRDDMEDKDFSPAPGTLPSSPKRRWTRDALRLDPLPRPATAAIDYALGSGSSHLGGLPRWIQDPEPPPCPSCHRTMPFLAHISEHELGDGDVDLFAFWCPGCSTTAVVPQQS